MDQTFNEKELATVNAQDTRMSLGETYDLAVKFRNDAIKKIQELHARYGVNLDEDNLARLDLGPFSPFSAGEQVTIENLARLALRVGDAVRGFDGAVEKLRKVGADVLSEPQPGLVTETFVKFEDLKFETEDDMHDYGREQEHIVVNPEKFSPEEVAAARVNLEKFIEAAGGHPKLPLYLRPDNFSP